MGNHSYVSHGASDPDRYYAVMKKMLSVLALVALGGAAAQQVDVPGVPVSFSAPAGLRALTQEQLRTVYQNRAVPAAVYTTDDRRVTVVFEYRQTPLRPAEVAPLVSAFGSVIRNRMPGVLRLQQDLIKIQGNDWAQFVYTTPGADGENRHEMLVTSANGRMLVVTVASTLRDYNRNEAALLGLTRTLRVQ